MRIFDGDEYRDMTPEEIEADEEFRRETEAIEPTPEEVLQIIMGGTP